MTSPVRFRDLTPCVPLVLKPKRLSSLFERLDRVINIANIFVYMNRIPSTIDGVITGIGHIEKTGANVGGLDRGEVGIAKVTSGSILTSKQFRHLCGAVVGKQSAAADEMEVSSRKKWSCGVHF